MSNSVDMNGTSHVALTDPRYPYIQRPDEISKEKTSGPEGFKIHFDPSVDHIDTTLDADHSSDEEDVIIDHGNIFSHQPTDATVVVNVNAASDRNDEMDMQGSNVFHRHAAKKSIAILSLDDGSDTEVEDDALFESQASGAVKEEQSRTSAEDKPCFTLRDYPEAVGYSFRTKTSMTGKYSPTAYLESTHASTSSNSSWQSTEPEVHVDSSREWEVDAESADEERGRYVEDVKNMKRTKWSEDDISLLLQLRDGRGLSFKRIRETRLFGNRTEDALRRAHGTYRSPKRVSVSTSGSVGTSESSHSGQSIEIADLDNDAANPGSEFEISKNRITGRDNLETPASRDIEGNLADSANEGGDNGYTEEEVRHVIELREKHRMTFPEIRETGLFGNRTSKAINGIYRKYRPITDVERKPVRIASTRHHRRWTDQEFATVLRLRRMGLNWGEIKRSGRFKHRTEAAIANGWQVAKERQGRQKEEAEEKRRREAVRDVAKTVPLPATSSNTNTSLTVESDSNSTSRYRWI